MTTNAVNEVRVQLETIEELFAPPAADPFDPQSRYISGMDDLVYQLTNLRLGQNQVRVVITLPATAIEPDLKEKTETALARYCAAQIEAANRELQLLRRRGQISLISSIVIILIAGVLVFLISTLNFVVPALQAFLVSGLGVFSWVALWDPFGIFLYEWREPARNRRIFTKLLQAELVIEYAVEENSG